MSGHPSYGRGSVSLADINAFRTSMSARRFPALREMRDEDIAALVIANKKVQCLHTHWNRVTVKPNFCCQAGYLFAQLITRLILLEVAAE